MVELPPHVHRVRKTRGGGVDVVYTFYTRGRNTAAAWPSIRMPEPLTADFAKASAICRDLERIGEGFLLYGAELPDHRAVDFWPNAFRFYDANERRKHSDAKDFTGLVEAFEASETFKALAESTQRGYRRSGVMVKAGWAFDMPAELTTVDAQTAIDALGDTPATANQFRAYLSRLMSWGIPRGYSTSNTIEHTEKVPGGEPWSPWPEWAFDTLLEHAPIHMLLPALSALFTGQRQGDILLMKRPRESGTTIEVRAQKTDNTVWIPIHSEYRKWIEKAPKGDAIQLHLGARGLPFQSADGFRADWQRMMNGKTFTRFRQERIVFHGLRKNAVINLLEVGCTEAEVGSIANMSEQMVRHYGRDVSLRALAKNGMRRLEERWAEVQPAALKTK